MVGAGVPGVVPAGEVTVGDGDPGAVTVGDGDPGLVGDGDPGAVGDGDPGLVGDGDPGAVGDGDPGLVGDGDPGLVTEVVGEGFLEGFFVGLAVQTLWPWTQTRFLCWPFPLYSQCPFTHWHLGFAGVACVLTSAECCAVAIPAAPPSIRTGTAAIATTAPLI
ncbi:hypothetical protein [Streptomyces sp. NPDC048191]|uniref:hypothetical protein n=1 Tax=Streptomyces sp. NPDC048191 TaxID=3155484 RepID=UPI0033EA44CC